jgi:uncharacterized membrane protein YhhN
MDTAAGMWLLIAPPAVAALLLAERLGRRRLRVVAKTLASVSFVAVGIARAGSGGVYGAWVVLALVLCALGDLALLHVKGLAGGLALFLLGHVAFVLAFQSLRPAASWPLGWVVPIALASGAAIRWLWPHLGRLRWAVAGYVTVITLMVWGAVSVSAAALVWRAVAVGAALFYASDLLVARDRFVSRSFVNRAWGLPAYYAGQLILAWSAGGGFGGLAG